jgi:hypothetical protein
MWVWIGLSGLGAGDAFGDYTDPVPGAMELLHWQCELFGDLVLSLSRIPTPKYSQTSISVRRSEHTFS